MLHQRMIAVATIGVAVAAVATVAQARDDGATTASTVFDYLASNPAGLGLSIALVFTGIVALQWICWLFGWGRFRHQSDQLVQPGHRSIGYMLTDLITNIISIRLAGDSSTNTGINSRNGLGTLEVPNGNGAVSCIGSIGASPLRVTIPAWVGRS